MAKYSLNATAATLEVHVHVHGSIIKKRGREKERGVYMCVVVDGGEKKSKSIYPTNTCSRLAWPTLPWCSSSV